MMFEENAGLARLLTSGQIFINDHWWMSEAERNEIRAQAEPWPEKACRTFSLNVNCNEVFAWACADAEEMMYDELEDVYEHFTKDPSWGTTVWCIKKRGIMPHRSVANAIRKAGVWDLDTMGLRENPVEVYEREKHAAKQT